MKQPLLLLTIAALAWSGSTHLAWAEWTVSCSDALYCYASNASDHGNFQLKVERGAKANIDLFVTVKPKEPLADNMLVKITVSDQNVDFQADVNKVYSGNEAGFSAEPDGLLVTSLRKGRNAQVSIRHGGSVGTLSHDVSLDGLTVALAEIDTLQGRAGRVDAAVLVGGIPAHETLRQAKRSEHIVAPESKVAPQARVQQTYVASGETWGNIFYENDDLPQEVNTIVSSMSCDNDALQAYGAQAIGMGQNGDFYFVPCFSGDVNIEHVGVHIDVNGAKQQLEFELPIGQNQPNRGTLINPQFDNQTGILTAVSYDSPNYDCGVSEEHQWISDGAFFELITYRIKSNCDGVQTQPEDFPLDWTIDEMGN